MTAHFQIHNLTIADQGRALIKDFNYTLSQNGTHVITGSHPQIRALSGVLSGGRDFQPISGTISFCQTPIESCARHELSRLGLFYLEEFPPTHLPFNLQQYLKSLYKNHKSPNLGVREFNKLLSDKVVELGISPTILQKELCSQFSDHEILDFEILQWGLLEPILTICNPINDNIWRLIRKFDTFNRHLILLTDQQEPLKKLVLESICHLPEGV